MRLAPSRPVRRLLGGLTSLLALAAALLFLAAPTCGGFAPGVKTFSRGALLIPMDVCYQCTTDGDGSTSPGGCGATGYATPSGPGLNGGRVCPQATDAGDVVKAYGLVYQLIRGGVPVYWVIGSGKTKLDDYDLTIHYGGGAPVHLYDWATGQPGAAPTALADVNYMGGLFVVDGTDASKAITVLRGNVDPTCTTACETNRARFGAVNVHVANVAFQADVARTMAGGWSAGGATPPKLALLDIGSAYADGSQAKNSEIVIRGYLQRAGLDFANAGGTSAQGAHGQIYDRLVKDDFLPSTPGDWKTTKLYQNGYQILWVPHWAAPGSCTDFSSNTACSNTQISDAEVAQVVETIGAFVTDVTDVDPDPDVVRPAGLKDLFAECAGLGSFEGVPGNNTYSPTWILSAQALTHFHTEGTPGFAITTGTPSAPYYWGHFANPLMQIGDFQFVPKSGAIATYDATSYKAGVVRLVSESANHDRDVFTFIPADATHGTIVYQGGHSYSGTDSPSSFPYQTAGTRLVLNTLFNLGASCVATGVQCSTGGLGVCGVGTMACDASGAQVCTPSAVSGPETCNGLDDDCDGLVDEDLARDCYTAPPGTEDVGLCHGGTQQCVRSEDGKYGFGACVGEQKPSSEICDGADNDCDGPVDEEISRDCYTGPSSSIDPGTGLPMGICTQGTQLCVDGGWGACAGQILPNPRECTIDDNAGNGEDDNCNGLVDEGCGCTVPSSQNCYSGPAGTQGVGTCHAGTQSCVDGSWGICTGQVVPVAEICGNGLDDDCDGVLDANEAACNTCVAQSCYDGPAGTAGDPGDPADVRACRAGTRACTGGVYGECLDQILPSIELCDGKDNDCDGHVDGDLNDNGVYDPGEKRPPCGDGLKCENGVCVNEVCGTEMRCQPGYECTDPVLGTCVPTLCPSAACQPGLRCDSGAMACLDPCEDNSCGPGTFCSGGTCTGGACYTEGCPAGQVCRDGSCGPDVCSAMSCPSGTFCRAGDCVQACAYVTCIEGFICGDDGFCAADPCHGADCGAGNTCLGGTCAPNLCASIDCGDPRLKVCRQYVGPSGWTATCFDNPCNAVACPTGLCLPREAIDCSTEPCIRAQCFALDNLEGQGTVPKEQTTESCGCGSGMVSPVSLLLGLLLIPLARRRRRPGVGLLAAVAATGLALGAAGCTRETTTGTDPADCVQACNVDAVVAPYVLSVSPASGLKGSPAQVTVDLAGARFAPGATLRVFPGGELAITSVGFVDDGHLTAALDLSAARRDTYLLRVVNPDKVISNLLPFDAVFMKPTLTGVTPTSVPVEGATLTLTGAGFTPASQCRVRSGSYTLNLPTALVAGGSPGTQLTCGLDSAIVPPGTVELSVLNEGDLESDARLPVTVAGPFAATALSPPTVAASCSNPPTCDLFSVHTVMTIYGSGFTSTCVVKADTNPIPTTQRPTTFLDPTRLTATLDLTSIPQASLPLTVHVAVAKGGDATVPLELAVVEATAGSEVQELAPQSAYQGEAGVTLALSGTALPTDSVVQILPPSGPNAGVWQDLPSSGGGTVVTGTLDLSDVTSWPAGDYPVRLHFPSAPPASANSVTFPFRVSSNVPVLWKVTPAGGAQDATVAVTVNGTTLFAGATLQLQGPAGFTRAPTGATVFTANPPGTATGTLAATFSLAGMNTGVFSLVAKNTASAWSSPLSFSLTPGQPTLTSVSPTSVSQSAAPLVTVTLSGGNYAKPDPSGVGGSMVFIQNVGLDIPPDPDGGGPLDQPWMTIPSDAVTVVDFDTIVVNLDTRATVPSAATPTPCQHPYSLKVVNPGSNLLESETRAFCMIP